MALPAQPIIAGNIPHTITRHAVMVFIVLRRGRDRWFLYRIEGQRDMKGDALIMKIHDLYDNEISSSCSFHRKRSFKLHRPVVAIATLSPSLDPTSIHSYPYEIATTSLAPSRELTAGFRRPHLLRTCRPFASDLTTYEHVLVGSPWRKAIAIDYELNKKFIIGLVGITLVMSMVVGVAVGLTARRTELGIATSAALFTLISILELLVIW